MFCEHLMHPLNRLTPIALVYFDRVDGWLSVEATLDDDVDFRFIPGRFVAKMFRPSDSHAWLSEVLANKSHNSLRRALNASAPSKERPSGAEPYDITARQGGSGARGRPDLPRNPPSTRPADHRLGSRLTNVLSWTNWRRRHQHHQAQTSHYRARTETG